MLSHIERPIADMILRSPSLRPAPAPVTVWFVAALLAFATARAPGVIFYSSADPDFNTTAPTGNLAGSGWQWQGRWGDFLGTPIAPNLFIAAKHVGGSLGQQFEFQGRSYTAIDSFIDPDSDLRIWKVCGIFPEYAGLYTGGDEVGKPLVVIGRGTQRGAEVLVNNGLTTTLKGWKPGTADHVWRWGENVVSGVIVGEANVGELLSATFDAGAGANEAHLSSGDSSGGVFIREGGVWKLAGINYAVDGPFNTNDTGAGFNAAIFDEGGLYTKPANDQWVLTPDLPVDKPSAFYATRISANLSWINSIVAQQSVTSYPPILQSTSSFDTPFADHNNYTVNETDQTITLDVPGGALFLRLRGCGLLEIDSTRLENGKWILHYVDR